MEKIKLRQGFSLLSVLFLPFVVQFYLLKDDSFNLSQEDKDFVRSYILPGYLVIALVIVYFVLNLINFFLLTDFFNKVIFIVSNIVIIFDLFFVLYLIYLILNDKKFDRQFNIDFGNIDSGNIGELLPFYNIYLLYKENRQSYYIKESIFLNFLIVFIYFLSPTLSFILFLIYVFRIISFYFGVNIVPKNIENFIKNLYNVNIEEIFSYFVAFLEWIYFNFIKNVNKSYKSVVLKYINWYSKIYDLNLLKKDRLLLFSWIIYGIFIIFLLFLIANSITYNNIYGYFVMALILFRYVVMFYYKKIIYIPIFTEVTSFIINLFDKGNKSDAGDIKKENS